MNKFRRSIKRKSSSSSSSLSIDRLVHDETVNIDDTDSSSDDYDEIADHSVAVDMTQNTSAIHINNCIKQIEQKKKYDPKFNNLVECLKRIRLSNIRFIQRETLTNSMGTTMKLKIIKEFIKEYEQIFIETEVIWPSSNDYRIRYEEQPIDEGKNIILNNGEKVLLVYAQQLPYPESMFKSGALIELYPDWFVHRFNQQKSISSSSSSEIKYFILSAFNVLMV